jgi:hypothetical protein
MTLSYILILALITHSRSHLFLLVSVLAQMSHPGLPGASSPDSNYIDLPSELQYGVALLRGADLSPWPNGPVSSPEVVSNTSASLIERFPVELRLKIFEPLCIFDGKMPALIIALRPLKKLYHEALQLFYKNSNFILHERNKFCLKDFGDRKEAALTIQKLTFLHPYVISPSTST